MDEEYRVHARAYLDRARTALSAGTATHLFYAAFELRAGIEVRLQEYLEHQSHVPSGRKRDWQNSKLGATASKAFQLERVARVRILAPGSVKPLWTVFYTPVTPELQVLGERLGVYLHAQRDQAVLDPSWWGTLRTTLEFGCALLSEATAGTLLGPPLINRATGQMYLPLELPDSEEPPIVPKVGASHVLDVAYFDSLADARGDAT
jgi:hypothetical protein